MSGIEEVLGGSAAGAGGTSAGVTAGGTGAGLTTVGGTGTFGGLGGTGAGLGGGAGIPTLGGTGTIGASGVGTAMQALGATGPAAGLGQGGLSLLAGPGSLGGAGGTAGLLSPQPGFLGQLGAGISDYATSTAKDIASSPISSSVKGAGAYKALRDQFKMPNVGGVSPRAAPAPLQAPQFGGQPPMSPAQRFAAIMNPQGR